MLMVFLLQSFNRITGNNKFPNIGLPQLSSSSKMPNISQGWKEEKKEGKEARDKKGKKTEVELTEKGELERRDK